MIPNDKKKSPNLGKSSQNNDPAQSCENVNIKAQFVAQNIYIKPKHTNNMYGSQRD
jgi:hypothetical protein